MVFETVRGRETAVERTRMYPQCVENIIAGTVPIEPVFASHRDIDQTDLEHTL